ncbi:D-alanyl-D-alanine carboxypeptidase family protein [Marinisporobacter balticus]|uniref:serine-type D-Ala-D-Ala carboxypeptidase n=1 Tax=Marinisporobacter balticus TaxID=2018667 RepID=A0A4R2KFQ2_9FIRM|nr:D-alanyl-D-alanine carboxypeptidase family protein [Marinisporobacter balticus]TCO71067.1 D-alanyl-D-alanine carboxypeptidase [Marinisporobacter balticus]
MKKIITIITVFIFILNFSFSFAQDEVAINANAVLLMEEKSGEILFCKSIKKKFPPASITKLMTYLVTMEAIGKVSMDDDVFISEKAVNERGVSYKLKQGETIKLGELVKVMMIVSANDAAMAIAEYVGGDEGNFVKMMNESAKALGMNNTHFVNPNGMPEKEVGNEMSAHDIAILAKYLINHYKEELLVLTDQEFYENPERNFYKQNTNGLLKIIPEVDGLKTGYTDEAGWCLASTMLVKKKNENEQDFRLISVVLGTESEWSRVKESKKLLEYGAMNFANQKIVKSKEMVQEINLWGAKKLPIQLLAKKDLWAFGLKEEIEKGRVVSLLDTMPYPIDKGQKLGELNITLYNEKIIQVDLISDRDVKKIPFWVLITKFWKVVASVFSSIL